MTLLVTSRVTPLSRYLLLVLLVACSWPVTGAELAITESTKIDFGSVVDRNGTVSLGLADAIVFDPFAIHVGDPVTTGEFLITGDPFATFSLSISGSTVGGLGIGTFETNEGTPPLLNVSLNATGQLDLRLGANLTVDSAQVLPAPNQPLLFTITINYN